VGGAILRERLPYAAGIFNQGIEEQRVLVCDSSAAKAVRSTLELCKPSLTHLFGGDESRIDKAVEAAKYSPYQAAHYRSKTPSHFHSSDSQEGRDHKKVPSSFKCRSSGKSQRPCLQEGGGPEEVIPIHYVLPLELEKINWAEILS
jgi:hypothetical protein